MTEKKDAEDRESAERSSIQQGKGPENPAGGSTGINIAKAKKAFLKKGRRVGKILLHGAIGFIIGCAATLIIGYAVFDIGRNYNPDAESQSGPNYTLTVLQERIQQCSELATATYLYTNAESFEDGKAILGFFDIPFLTGKNFILKYDGIIKAGVNLDEADIEQADNGALLVTLPKPHIISHEFDEGSFRVLQEHETVFSSIKIDDIQNFRAEQKEAMEARAYEVGVMEEAAENAQASIRAMLEMVVPEGTPIEFLQQQ